VLPGLIDAHVHLSSLSSGNPLLAYRQSDSEQALTALIFARRTLAAGFTTVRDLASGHEVMYAVRNAIRAGRYIGPRILVAGLPITARGGHGDFPGSREDLWQDREARESGICWDEGSCRDAVRAQIKRGADVITLMASGGFSSGTGALQQLTAGEMRAVVEAAQMRGIRVTTHAYATSAIADAVRSGVNSVEHGIGLGDQIGRIAPGFVADIIAVKGDPLADPAALESVDFVMKAGRIGKQDGAMLPAERWDGDRYAHP
jgi:imidazolonepropionase-like amidohydrolase